MLEGLKGTIIHVDDELTPRTLVKEGFAKTFGVTREQDGLPDVIVADDVVFRSFSEGQKLEEYVSDDERLAAMLTVGMIVAIIDGQIESRGFFDIVKGSEVADTLRRRVSEVLPQFPERTMENSLFIISYSGGNNKFGDTNIYKGDILPHKLVQQVAVPVLEKAQ